MVVDKYEPPVEYRIKYKHSGEATECYHYYNCYSSREAVDTFNKIAVQKNWDDLKIIEIEEYNRWSDKWIIVDHDLS